MEVITIEARTFDALMQKIETLVEKIDALNRANADKTMQEWLDGEDVCCMLNITPRTLQSYRDNGAMPYTRIGNKMYYKADDLKNMLNK